MINKRVQNGVLECNLKSDRMISVSFQGKAFNITVTQVFALSRNAEEADRWTVLWRPTRPSRSNTPKICPFIIGDRNAKVGSQEIPGLTGKFGLGVQNEARQKLIEFCQENTLVIANTLFQKHKRRLYIWTSPDGQQQNQIDYILCSRMWRSQQNQTGSWLWFRSWVPYCKNQA